jgi:hypothetical protein
VTEVQEQPTFTVIDAVADAFARGSDDRMKAEVLLTVYKAHPLSKPYRKAVKKIAKATNRLAKHERKGRDEGHKSVVAQRTVLEQASATRERCVDELLADRDDVPFEDAELIATQLMRSFRQGLMLMDLARGEVSAQAPYGKIVRTMLKKLCALGPFKAIKAALGRHKKSYWKLAVTEDPRLKDKRFIATREGAQLMETHFVLFLLEFIGDNLSPEAQAELLDEIVAQAGRTSAEMQSKLKDARRVLSTGSNFSKVVLQLIRLTVGRGIVINQAVVLTNIIVKAVMGRGLAAARNALLKRLLARFLGTGPLAIIVNVALLLPDIALLVNRRDYIGLTNVLLFFYFLRNEQSLNEEPPALARGKPDV